MGVDRDPDQLQPKIDEFYLAVAVTETATICLRPLQVDNIFIFIRQVAPVPACWLFKTSATSC